MSEHAGGGAGATGAIAPDAAGPVDVDEGGVVDAGMNDRAAASLSAAEAASLCGELSHALGTQMDTQRFCRLQALPHTLTSRCSELEDECRAAGRTGEFRDCSAFSTALTDCSATSDELNSCFAKIGAAIAVSTCSERGGYPPTCLSDLQDRCPGLRFYTPIEPTCQGTPEPCGWQDKPILCRAQKGCYTDTPSTFKGCLGEPVPCREFGTAMDCYEQYGCDWSEPSH